MDANKIRLLEFLGTTKKTFNIPVYQRNYDWKEEHCIQLFKDIENIVKHNYSIEHFLGTVVYVVSYVQPNFQELVLIDGQQRVTSITLLLKAIHDAIDDQDLKEDIYETYLINKRAPEELRIKLKPIETDAVPYEQVIHGEISKEDSNLVKNYRLFQRLLQESDFSAQQIYDALGYIQLVYIQLEKDKASENPQMIFESLNSTGLNLKQADLIRNFLLMNHGYDEQTHLYKHYWMKIESYLTNDDISDFVRDYLTMKNGTICKKDKVYEKFKEFAHDPETNMDEEGLLDDLCMYAQYYSWFISCNSPNDTINDRLYQLQQLRATVTYPVLLYVFEDCYEYHTVKDSELIQILELLLSYLLRRMVCGYPSNALNKIFASMPKVLDDKKSDGEYLCLVEALKNRSASGMFPRDDEFRQNFISKEFYKTKIDKYILHRLESYESNEVIAMTDKITIEHIMPRSLTPKWRIDLGQKCDAIYTEFLHTIGNLTFTGYNSELSNKSFDEKKTMYLQSNVAICRQIAAYEKGGRDEILDRASKLFEIAVKIRPLPEGYDDIAVKSTAIDFATEYNIMDDLDVTGLKPRNINILDEVHAASSWKDMLRVLVGELYDLDKERLCSLVKHPDFKGVNRRAIDITDENMISPYRIAESLYIETNFSASTILNYCKMLAQQFELEDDIYFMLRP